MTNTEWKPIATAPTDGTVFLVCGGKWRPSCRPVMCDDCGKCPADLPGRLCPGCHAYQGHTGGL